jgi:hypothetical protein
MYPSRADRRYPIRDADVLDLARFVCDAGFDDTAERLEHAWQVEAKVLALTVDERRARAAVARSRRPTRIQDYDLARAARSRGRREFREPRASHGGGA